MRQQPYDKNQRHRVCYTPQPQISDPRPLRYGPLHFTGPHKIRYRAWVVGDLNSELAIGQRGYDVSEDNSFQSVSESASEGRAVVNHVAVN